MTTQGEDTMTDRQDYTEDTTGTTPHAGAPVDVRIVDAVLVQEFPARSWAPGQTPVAADPVQIAPPHHARVSLRITNTGAQPVWLGPAQSNCTQSGGYPLAALASIVMETRAAIWAVAAPGQPSTVATLAQFKDG